MENLKQKFLKKCHYNIKFKYLVTYSEQMSSKRKVIMIRNFKKLCDVPETYKEKQWSILEKEVTSILNSPNYPNSLEELYRIAEDLCTQKYNPLLYNLQLVIETYLQKKLDDLSAQPDTILPSVDLLWKEFCRHVRTVKNIFLCLDRSSKNFKYNTVQSVSLGLFTSVIVLNSKIKQKIINELLYEIYSERQGNQIDQELLHSIIEMLNTLQIYEDIFQAEFLKSSQYFYEDEGRKFIEIYDIPQYLSLVNKRIDEEHARIKNYLIGCTEKPLLDIVYKQLIENYITKILDKGFDELVEKAMFEELILIYKLFQRITDGNKYLVTYFNNFVYKKGIILTNSQNESNMIQDLLDFKDKLENIISTSFEGKNCFHECIRNAFKKFVGGCNSKAAQLLAKYLDNKLRCKDLSEEDLEVILSKVIKLFKYVQGKDIFEAFYKKHLATRLLLGKSTSQDAENSMIAKLKHECGDAFTSNIEGMFQDMNLSKTINNSFKQRQRNPNNIFVGDFSVNILTSSYWPNYPNFEVNLPLELLNYQLAFQKFYLNNHSGRKLLWRPSLGHCLVRASFECGPKELQVSLFQAIVLLLFNNIDSLTLKEIQGSTSLEISELKKTLLSLSCSRNRVLHKDPKGKDIKDEDKFVFNPKFTNKLFRVRINQVQLQDTAEQEKETEKHVLVDRQFQIDAAIVRIMKNRKTIKHSMLIQELYGILDIPVSQTDLKKRIELLIEREYMERDKENKSNYIYIA